MFDFAYAALPVRVVFAPKAARERLTEVLDELRVERVLVVVSAREEALARELVLPFGDRVAGTFTEVRPHVPVEVAERARAAAADVDADAILSIGGGSTTGLAKAVALTSGLPIVAVPTTYAGSEVTAVWGLTEQQRKTTGRDAKVLPRAVVYDPELTLSLPPAISAVSGLNALAHCVEAFWAPGANPVTSLIAEEGIRALGRGLPEVVARPRDVNARGDVLYGAWLAGTAFAVAGSGLHHKACHVLGGAYNLPHAETHAVMLPHTTALVAPAVAGADARIAEALGAHDATAGQAVAVLLRALDAPTSLRELGLAEEQLPEAARLVAEQAPAEPGGIGLPEIEGLLRAAFDGVTPAAAPSPAAELARREQALTDEVVASFAKTPDPRTREVLQQLVRHLHAFARDVRLTQPEWETAIGFLTRAGQISTDKRQEMILLSDVLGLSMLTVGINAPPQPSATEATVFGPFFVEASPEVEYGADVAAGMSGEPCWVEGVVTALDGTPVAGARIEVWEADDDGFYDVQYKDGRLIGRAHMFTDVQGRYGFWSVRPTAYPIPHDGPVGELLTAAQRSPMRPAHIHFMVRADGFHTLVTHVFAAGGPHLDDDAVFGVKESLVYDFSEHPPGAGPTGRQLDARWFQLVFDIRLAPTAGERQ